MSTSSAVASPASRLFTVAGGSAVDGPLLVDRPATEAPIEPEAVVGLPDGGVAFFDSASHRVLRVDRSGRIGVLAGNGRTGDGGDGGPATHARLESISGLAVHPSGILLADEVNGTIRLVRDDGVIVRLAGGGSSYADGVLATRASIGVSGIAVTPGGDILATDWESDRVRRIAQDGTITTFAGGGRSRARGDGAPATQARLDFPTSVAVAPDGSVYIAEEGGLRRVSPDGTISTLTRDFGFWQVAVAAFGVVGVDDSLGITGLVVAVDATGALQTIAGGARLSAFDGDGEPPLGTLFHARYVAAAADGGLLISARDAVRYLPPEAPQKLAIAITRPTLTSPRRLRVSVATTMPATVTLKLAGAAGRVSPVQKLVQEGDNTLELGRRLAPGTYGVRVVARGADGQVATDEQIVFLGGLLSVRSARQLAAGESARPPLRARFTPGVGRCRRFGRRRVDCAVLVNGRCWNIASIRLHRDGLPYVRSSNEIGDCRFRRHFAGTTEPVEP